MYAPWRDQAFLPRFRGRTEMIDYCETHKLPIKASKNAPYSTDANLLGLTHEAGKLEHLDCPPWFVTPGMGVLPKDAPDAPETVTVRFEKGRPVAINGKKTTAFQAIQQANAIGGRHARRHRHAPRREPLRRHQEPRRVRGPGHGAARHRLRLPAATRARPPRPRAVRPAVAVRGEADLPGVRVRPRHAHGPRRRIAPVNALATGTIRLKLYKGRAEFDAAEDVPHQMYSESNASMEAIGEFDHADSEGFLRVLQVSAGRWRRTGRWSRRGWAAKYEATGSNTISMWTTFSRSQSGRSVSNRAASFTAPKPVAMLPGSFNPLHHGHTALAAVAAARLGVPVAFELSSRQRGQAGTAARGSRTAGRAVRGDGAGLGHAGRDVRREGRPLPGRRVRRRVRHSRSLDRPCLLRWDGRARLRLFER